MRKYIKWAVPICCYLLVLILGFRQSNLDWHRSNNFWIVWGRYSTEYFFLLLTLFLFATSLVIHFIKTPASGWQKWLKISVEAGLIVAYSLSAGLVLTEYYLHHHPRLVLGANPVMTREQLHLAMSEGIPDDQLGKLNPPNQHNPTLQTPFDLRQYYPPSEWRDQPSPAVEYRSDSHGFRNDADHQRVDMVTLGDSFTHGPHVEREAIWSSIVADHFHLREVNLAMSGFSPVQETLVLKRFGLPLKPDLVVMQFFYGNDLDDTARFLRWKASGKTYAEFLKDEIGSIPPLFLTGNFLIQFFQDSIGFTGSHVHEPVQIRLEDRTVKMGFHTNLYILMQSEEVIINYEGWQPMLDAIGEANTLSQANDIQFVLCMVPQKIAVYIDCIADRYNLKNVLEQQFPHQIPLDADGRMKRLEANRSNLPRLMHQFCQDNGITYVDLTEPFQTLAKEEGELLYFPLDSHWNPKGHKRAAEIIIKMIEEL